MAFAFTDENTAEIIESGKPVVIDFWQNGVDHARKWHLLSTNWLKNLRVK